MCKCAETVAVLEAWAALQGQARCWWHPSVIQELAALHAVPIPDPVLPPRSEFVTGCQRYQTEQYGSSFTQPVLALEVMESHAQRCPHTQYGQACTSCRYVRRLVNEVRILRGME